MVERRDDAVVASIRYTRPASAGARTGVRLGRDGFALTSAMFRAQHGAVRDAPYAGPLENALVARPCRVRDARTATKKTLATVGFELLGPGLAARGMPRAADVLAALEEHNEDHRAASSSSSSSGRPPPLERYYRFLEAALLERTGASFARAFTHTARLPGVHAGYGDYAHTDCAARSWPTLLRGGQREPDTAAFPTGLGDAAVARASKARRVAVVTVWRYLGPEPHARHSHLALLDHATLASATDDSAEVLDFDIRTLDDDLGHNYRLADHDDGRTSEHHRWWYFPGLDRDDEAVAFVAFDSAGHAAFAHADKLPVATLVHAAFLDPRAADHPDRHSIDCRVLLAWDDDGDDDGDP